MDTGGKQNGNICADVNDINYERSQFQLYKEQSVSSGKHSNDLHKVMKVLILLWPLVGHLNPNSYKDFFLHNLSFLSCKRARCDMEAIINKFCKNTVNVKLQGCSITFTEMMSLYLSSSSTMTNSLIPSSEKWHRCLSITNLDDSDLNVYEFRQSWMWAWVLWHERQNFNSRKEICSTG